MGTPPKHHVMIIAGEASGDMRAAGLAAALKHLCPGLRLTGVGGQHMRDAGVECFADITELAVIGIAEVVKNFRRIKKVFDQVLRQVEKDSPSAIVLVDYPGFNLRLAREIKKRNICHSHKSGNPLKIIYYISPQVWAWRESRVQRIKELVDRMIVLFPFEQATYAKYGMTVDYAGHPLVDEIIVKHSQTELLKSLGLSASKTTIGLMPGSRAKEVERHLPCMLSAAQKLFERNQDRQFVLLKASSIAEELIEEQLRFYKHLPLKVYDGTTYDGINAMDVAIIASGTATLEAALLKKPMVIIYKTSWPTYAIAKNLIKIPYIGLANIVAGKKVAEELIQNKATAQNIADAVEAALHNPNIVEELRAVKAALGEPGASCRAAQVVVEELAT